VNGRRRALGQHFLRDPGIARAIVDLVAPTERDLVVEIGPGEGALTVELARRGGRLIALEVDSGLIESLRRRLPQVEVQHADARGWDYGALARPAGGRVLVVGNLPYSVSKPIVTALQTARRSIDVMALMLQREVAERLAAPPGGKVYGALSFGYGIEHGGRETFLEDLYITPALRSRGYGGLMCTALEKAAREAGCFAMHLEVMPGNRAEHLYRRIGFGDRGSKLLTKALS